MGEPRIDSLKRGCVQSGAQPKTTLDPQGFDPVGDEIEIRPKRPSPLPDGVALVDDQEVPATLSAGRCKERETLWIHQGDLGPRRISSIADRDA